MYWDNILKRLITPEEKRLLDEHKAAADKLKTDAVSEVKADAERFNVLIRQFIKEISA